MTESDDTALAGLLCARLCHDLSGPITAAAAGTELLAEMGADSETIALVATAATAAVQRLKFLRAAFGPASADQKSDTLATLSRAFLDSTTSQAAPTFVLDWRVAAPTLPADGARLLLNLILLIRDCLPMGGTVTIIAKPKENGGAAATVIGRGRNATLPPDSLAALAGNPATGPKGAQAALARFLAGGMVQVTQNEAEVTLTVD